MSKDQVQEEPDTIENEKIIKTLIEIVGARVPHHLLYRRDSSKEKSAISTKLYYLSLDTFQLFLSGQDILECDLIKYHI